MLCYIYKNITSNTGLYIAQLNTAQILENISVTNVRLRNIIKRIKDKGGLEIYNIKSGRYALRTFQVSKEFNTQNLNALVKTMTTVFALFIGVTFYNEQYTATQIYGIIITIVGIYLITKKD